MNVTPVTLEGERVRLVPLAPEHVEGLYEAAQAPEIWPYLPYAIDSLEKTRFFIEQSLKLQNQGSHLVFTIIDKETDRIVGSTRYLEISPSDKNLEIGFTWYNPSVWRSRVNSECKYLLLRHAFETLGCIRVQFKTDSRNERSQNAIMRLGAVKEGTLRNHRILADGYIRDSVCFSILDREWADVKTRLEGFLG
jgi:RimJ/RimL family protein N-acetyltransferase